MLEAWVHSGVDDCGVEVAVACLRSYRGDGRDHETEA